MSERAFDPSYRCRLCKKRGRMGTPYEEQKRVCGDCIRSLANLYSLSHTGAPHPDFCSEEEWKDRLAILAERKRSKKQPIPQGLRMRVFERDGFKCQHCGTMEKLRADHIHPEVHGGDTSFENLQTLCRSCNARKGHKVPSKGTAR